MKKPSLFLNTQNKLVSLQSLVTIFSQPHQGFSKSHSMTVYERLRRAFVRVWRVYERPRALINPPHSHKKSSLATPTKLKAILRRPSIMLRTNHEFVYNA